MKIEGVVLSDKKIIGNAEGQVMHVLRSDDPQFVQFGEVYVSTIVPGVTKGWKCHMRSVSNLVVPLGHVRFVLFDAREGSPSYGVYDDVTIGVTHYSMLSIPPGVVYAWRTVGEETAMVLNCATELWAPDESTNQPLDTYTYSWE